MITTDGYFYFRVPNGPLPTRADPALFGNALLRGHIDPARDPAAPGNTTRQLRFGWTWFAEACRAVRIFSDRWGWVKIAGEPKVLIRG